MTSEELIKAITELEDHGPDKSVMKSLLGVFSKEVSGNAMAVQLQDAIYQSVETIGGETKMRKWLIIDLVNYSIMLNCTWRQLFTAIVFDLMHNHNASNNELCDLLIKFGLKYFQPEYH